MEENETQEIETPATEVEESEATTEELVEVEEIEEDKPKPDKVQKRINKLTYDKREAERKADYWKNKANEQVATEPTGKPDRFDFDDEDKYLDALFDYKDQRRTVKQKAQNKKEQEEETQQIFQDSVQGLINKGIQEFEDYDSVVVDNPALIVSNDLVQAVTEMDDGHLVAYHLGKNPEKATEIDAMTPYKRAIALNSIEKQLTAKASKKTTQAPPPIEPVGSTTDVNIGAEPDAGTDPEGWTKWRQEQKHKGRTG